MALWPAVSTGLAAIVAVGCSSPAPAPTAVVQPSASVDEPAPQSFGYTNQRSDGNRVAAGAGSLPDARILSDGSGRLLLLTGATDRCGHGVLGDSIEAGAVTLVESRPEPSVVFTISIPDPAVVEGIAPIWTDLTGDGRREVIVTVSDASGPPIGRGLRWRHEIAVAPFGPGGETEISAVTLPDGSMAVGVGRDDGTLCVWLPIP